MTNLKRMPKPMTEKQIAQYQELRDNLMMQAELIMTIFHPFNDREHVTEVKFHMEHPDWPSDWPSIEIWYQISRWDGDSDDCLECPESYLGMTEDELRAEKKSLDEEEKRKREERAAKAKAAREKRKAKKEAEKKVREKDERYKKYLELKAEFEDEKDSKVIDKPKKESVYACKHWEYEYDDFGKYSLCYNRNCKLQTCDCKRIYAQQFCPFYEKGELRGKWVISDEDKQAAEEFKKEFVGKEVK